MKKCGRKNQTYRRTFLQTKSNDYIKSDYLTVGKFESGKSCNQRTTIDWIFRERWKSG